jgi:hypothetical protein
MTTTRHLRARLERLGVPAEPAPESIEDETAKGRLLDLLLQEFSSRGTPLTAAEQAELAELQARFPSDPADPLSGACEAWRAAASAAARRP